MQVSENFCLNFLFLYEVVLFSILASPLSFARNPVNNLQWVRHLGSKLQRRRWVFLFILALKLRSFYLRVFVEYLVSILYLMHSSDCSALQQSFESKTFGWTSKNDVAALFISLYAGGNNVSASKKFTVLGRKHLFYPVDNLFKIAC